jgi:uncharacterized protein (TIGR03435 family)
MKRTVGVGAAILAAFTSLLPPRAHPEADDPTVGDAAPPLVVDAPEGVATDWADLRGQVVVLEFWATWCSPCIPALDHLGRLQAELAGEDLVFLGISPEERERMDAFLETREVAFPIALDRGEATFEAYGARIVPTTVVVGRDGRIAARTRPDRLTADVLRRILAGEPSGLEVVHDVASNIEWEPEESTDGEVFARLVIAESQAAGGGYKSPPGSGRISGDGMHRDNMIQIAYGVPHTRIVSSLPAWSKGDPVWKLNVLAPGGDDELARAMLAAAIEVKFRLQARYEEREVDVLALTFDPETHEWPETTAPESEHTFMAFGGGLTMVGGTMEPVRSWFENVKQKPVIDETGLEGLRDLELEWVDGASFDAALAEHGLELWPERRKVRFLVVEPL